MSQQGGYAPVADWAKSKYDADGNYIKNSSRALGDFIPDRDVVAPLGEAPDGFQFANYEGGDRFGVLGVGSEDRGRYRWRDQWSEFEKSPGYKPPPPIRPPNLMNMEGGTEKRWAIRDWEDSWDEYEAEFPGAKAAFIGQNNETAHDATISKNNDMRPGIIKGVVGAGITAGLLSGLGAAGASGSEAVAGAAPEGALTGIDMASLPGRIGGGYTLPGVAGTGAEVLATTSMTPYVRPALASLGNSGLSGIDTSALSGQKGPLSTRVDPESILSTTEMTPYVRPELSTIPGTELTGIDTTDLSAQRGPPETRVDPDSILNTTSRVTPNVPDLADIGGGGFWDGAKDFGKDLLTGGDGNFDLEDLLALAGTVVAAKGIDDTGSDNAPVRPPSGPGTPLPQTTFERTLTGLPNTEDYFTYGQGGGEHRFFSENRPVAEAIPENIMGAAAGGRAGDLSPIASRIYYGEGTGRSDDIPAQLSDGEYVMDSETVAMLGDGSIDAGADRLDEMRTNLRKHKGENLVKGEISSNARSPIEYMAKGGVAGGRKAGTKRAVGKSALADIKSMAARLTATLASGNSERVRELASQIESLSPGFAAKAVSHLESGGDLGGVAKILS